MLAIATDGVAWSVRLHVCVCLCVSVTVRFTLSLWLYVNNHCPHASLARCCISQHITWDDRYATPQLYFNHKGKTTHLPWTPVLYLSPPHITRELGLF